MAKKASRRTCAAFVAAIGTALALSAGAVQGRVDDDIAFASLGEFRLHDGEARLIVDPRIVTGSYRICVTRTASDIPLAVVADGIEAMVRVGECRTFNAGRIRIAAADKLAGHSVLAGTFEHLMK
jgi:hypothetical protein